MLDPDREAELLAGAEDKPLYAIKERCQKARATSRTNDPIETAKRIYASRHFSSWSDAEGAFCYQGRDTADRGAQILARIAQVGGGLRRAQRSGDHPVHEHDGAVRADAFYALVTRRSLGPDGRLEDGGQVGDGGGGLDSSIDADGFAPGTRDENSDDPLSADSLAIIDRPPTCSVMVRVDLAALLRGTTHPGECCAIDNQGPISVPMARDMANDSYMRFVFHEAGDIRAVSHFGRTINRHLRTALAYRDMTCVVPGCGVSSGLEIDHVIPFAEGGPTALENLALLCHHHHFLKTFEGWTLSRDATTSTGPPHWRFEPEPPFGQEPDLGIDTSEGRAAWWEEQGPERIESEERSPP